MVGPMSTTFWLLDIPRNQPQATVAGDTKFEQITCPANEYHTRGGRRLGELRATINPAGIKDFTWTWSHDILVSERVLDVFLKHRITGYEIQLAKLSYSERSQGKPPTMHELVVTGWAGMASSAAGLTLANSCPACDHRNYAIAEPSRLIDPASWDGSDLFIVWPLPLFRFASERLANIPGRTNCRSKARPGAGDLLQARKSRHSRSSAELDASEPGPCLGRQARDQLSNRQGMFCAGSEIPRAGLLRPASSNRPRSDRLPRRAGWTE